MSYTQKRARLNKKRMEIGKIKKETTIPSKNRDAPHRVYRLSASQLVSLWASRPKGGAGRGSLKMERRKKYIFPPKKYVFPASVYVFLSLVYVYPPKKYLIRGLI